jgi:hypothetical protein
VYTHNLFDAHATHVAVTLHLLAALHTVPAAARPRAVYGCEVWRSLDWLPKQYRVELDVTGYEALGQALIAVFASQLSGGKRFDVASLGRKRANATFGEPNKSESVRAMDFALDLSPFLRDDLLQPEVFSKEVLNAFSESLSLRG